MIVEKKWDIGTPDSHRIHGVRNSSGEDVRSAVFIVHGLTGNMYEYTLKRAADFLSQKHDVYRFNLYDGEPGARRLLDCTLQTHADDLNTVLDHFSASYEKIFLIGHSYGGPTIMIARSRRVTAVSLWDPSFDLKSLSSKFANIYDEKDEFVIINWGVATLIGKKMYREKENFDNDACCELARVYEHPVQVVHAGKGVLKDNPVSYHSFGNPLNISDVVAEAGHCFYEGSSCDELLEKTSGWFDRF